MNTGKEKVLLMRRDVGLCQDVTLISTGKSVTLNLLNGLILVTNYGQEKVLLMRRDVGLCQDVTMISDLICVTVKLLIIVLIFQEKTGVHKNSNGMVGKLRKVVIMLASDTFLAI